MTNSPVTYECPIAGAEHALPGPDVRVMKIGDGGFVVACDCGPEDLEDADEEPHPTEDHIVNVYADDPSPEEWLVLEDSANGWYGTTRWHSPEDYDGTLGQRRAEFRDRIEEIADTDDGRDLEPDETEIRAREVECPACGANEGHKCQRPSGHRVRKPHAARVDAVTDTIDEPATLGQSDLSAFLEGST